MKTEEASIKLYKRLRVYDEVVGIGVSSINDSYCIVVYLSISSEDILKKIPSIYYGNLVKTEITGNFYFEK